LGVSGYLPLPAGCLEVSVLKTGGKEALSKAAEMARGELLTYRFTREEGGKTLHCYWSDPLGTRSLPSCDRQ
jgi:hypothetical protein